ncbi:MAG: Bax inhibitor-1/YccA family protein [Phycisphaeraceae bacterium]|nr:Bax inhibitor-1/YccA family protein [Phycisphaerales bacterium]MCB9860187.1 Bax inhibitor-1/YccA family protein [Phycisphaeraceae bacterium]
MRTGNPTLNAFSQYAEPVGVGPRSLEEVLGTKARPTTMSLRGTVIATSILMGICATTAFASFPYFDSMMTSGRSTAWMWVIGLMAGSFVIALILGFNPKAAPILAPIYAIAEGAWLAVASLAISYSYLDKVDPHLISYGIIGTFCVGGGLCAAYSLGLIRISGTVAKILVVAISAVSIYAVVMFASYMFGFGLPNLFTSVSPIGIGFTALCILLASAALILDFQFVEAGIRGGAPKYLEWYAGFTILVTLAWLYIEILRLLAKIAALTRE